MNIEMVKKIFSLIIVLFILLNFNLSYSHDSNVISLVEFGKFKQHLEIIENSFKGYDKVIIFNITTFRGRVKYDLILKKELPDCNITYLISVKIIGNGIYEIPDLKMRCGSGPE
jgi:hypothetical protein